MCIVDGRATRSGVAVLWRSFMKQGRRSSACLAVLAISVGCPVSAQQDASPPAVLVQPAELKPLAAQSEYVGRAAVFNKVELRAQVRGVLGARHFTDGGEVKEGQLLFTIDPRPYQAVVNQRTARCSAARAALANAETQLQRAAELLRTSTGSQATYDQKLSEQLQAVAQLEEANAQLEDAEIQLSYTQISSPITGRIGRATVSPGNTVGPETGILATIVSERQMRVFFLVSQRELLQARRDMAAGAPLTVQLRLADGSIYREKGKVDFIDVTVDPKTDGQMARAVFDNSDELLTDGQTVRVIVQSEKVPEVLVVPQASVAIDQTGPYVYVVGAGNVAELRRVKTGVARKGMIAVTEGLKAGENVIVQGQQRVKPGATVVPRPAPSAAPMPPAAPVQGR